MSFWSLTALNFHAQTTTLSSLDIHFFIDPYLPRIVPRRFQISFSGESCTFTLRITITSHSHMHVCDDGGNWRKPIQTRGERSKLHTERPAELNIHFMYPLPWYILISILILHINFLQNLDMTWWNVVIHFSLTFIWVNYLKTFQIISLNSIFFLFSFRILPQKMVSVHPYRFQSLISNCGRREVNVLMITLFELFGFKYRIFIFFVHFTLL